MREFLVSLIVFKTISQVWESRCHVGLSLALILGLTLQINALTQERPVASHATVVKAANNQNPISIPIFSREKWLTQKHTNTYQEKDYGDGTRPPFPLHLLRARNLLAAGHYEEALADYPLGVGSYEWPGRAARQIESGWAIAFEKVGKYDEAIEHAKKAEDDELLAKLRIRKGQYAEAKEIADKEIADLLSREQKEHFYQHMLPEWLRARAYTEYELGDFKNAIDDLENAARRYFKDNEESATLCGNEANAVLKQIGSNKRIQLYIRTLPDRDAIKVLALIKYLSTSPAPLSIPKLNQIMSAHIKLRRDSYHSNHAAEVDPLPFRSVDYRLEKNQSTGSHLLTTYIAVDCDVPKSEIDRLRLLQATDAPPLSTFSSGAQKNAEMWKLPRGTLLMSFGESGAQTLNYLEFVAANPKQVKTVKTLLLEVDRLGSDFTARKIELLTEAINLDANVPSLYADRANLFCTKQQFSKALQDAKHAVSIGGKYYLPVQASVEDRMGAYHDAIASMETFLGNHMPGPETASTFIKLAEIQREIRDYMNALDSANKALSGSIDPADALFVKAKVEADLHQYLAAQSDATKAAEMYFEKAEILNRDNVVEWLTKLPSN